MSGMLTTVAPALMVAVSILTRKSLSDLPASSHENSTSDTKLLANVTALIAVSMTFSGAILSLCSM